MTGTGVGQKRPTSAIPVEQTQMIRDLIGDSGMTQQVISRRSREVALAYKELCPIELPEGLTESTVSRMKTGSDLKKQRRRNLVLLYLTISHFRASEKKGLTPSLHAAEEADNFADSVLHAGGADEEQKLEFFDPNDPRHNRAAILFGEHGVGLIESAFAHDDAHSFQKLAALQWLSGNTDDAHYWNSCAQHIAQDSPERMDTEAAKRLAFTSGRSYLFKGEGAVAETYFRLAGNAGHADAAFLLAEFLETLQRDNDARHWFSTAEKNGHSEAGVRLAALEDAAAETKTLRHK